MVYLLINDTAEAVALSTFKTETIIQNNIPILSLPVPSPTSFGTESQLSTFPTVFAGTGSLCRRKAALATFQVKYYHQDLQTQVPGHSHMEIRLNLLPALNDDCPL
jgi:hypothetical protein